MKPDDPSRRERLSGLFHAALERPPEERAAFLEQACRGDEAAREELASLLAAHDEAGTFLEQPAAAEHRALLEDDPGPSLAGRQVGPYAVQREIGRGGMGVVYLAYDTRLARVVALKALAPQFTGDEARRERLRREARAAAALSHPGVATVYALEESGSGVFIVSEFVAGRTLRAILDQGPLPLGEALRIAYEVAAALEAAHAGHIVHRDLKPENVIRREDGGIKVLDFGLARFVGAAGGERSLTRLTELGTILGTPAYMSPEQLRGEELDFRTDVFSFGVLLLELVTGRNPFEGSDPASTIGRILHIEPPPLLEARPDVPAELDRVVRRCLTKNREERYGATRDLVRDLERLRRDIDVAAGAEASAGARADTSQAPAAARADPLWWWQVHQLLAALVYWLMVYPVWRVREWIDAPWGLLLFFGILVSVIVSANLRLHLWFTSRYYPSSLTTQRGQSSRWILWGDRAFAALLVVAGALIAREHAAWATLLVSLGTGSLLASVFIEPATARAAFRRPRRAGGKTSGGATGGTTRR